jgi:hypothetical protein
MRLLRGVSMVGWGLIILLLPVLVFASDSRPSLYTLGIGVGIGLAIGVVAGLLFQLLVPLERRLRLIRSLNPRLARRLMPPASVQEKRDTDIVPRRPDAG